LREVTSWKVVEGKVRWQGEGQQGCGQVWLCELGPEAPKSCLSKIRTGPKDQDEIKLLGSVKGETLKKLETKWVKAAYTQEKSHTKKIRHHPPLS
jgi:hypothetical protein